MIWRFGDLGFRDPGSSYLGSWSPRIGAFDEIFQSLGFKFLGLRRQGLRVHGYVFEFCRGHEGGEIHFGTLGF